MSSTRRTLSPGVIVKPRRNSRRGGLARLACHLLGEDRPGAQLAAGLEREHHAAGRRAGDQVHDRRAVAVARCAPAQNAAQLARGGRVLEHLELLQVGVRVAAALEREVALAQGAARAEQGLGAGGDRAPGGLVQGASEGGHRGGILAALRRERVQQRVPAAEVRVHVLVDGRAPGTPAPRPRSPPTRPGSPARRGSGGQQVVGGRPGPRRRCGWASAGTCSRSAARGGGCATAARAASTDRPHPVREPRAQPLRVRVGLGREDLRHHRARRGHAPGRCRRSCRRSRRGSSARRPAPCAGLRTAAISSVMPQAPNGRPPAMRLAGGDDVRLQPPLRGQPAGTHDLRVRLVVARAACRSRG